jgi:translation elongation factor EF-Tu-like GTPase
MSLLPTEQGGKSHPIVGPYRPNHNFATASDAEFSVGQVEFLEGQPLSPGQSANVEVRFIAVPGLSEKLQPGREWRIQEANRLVGFATVLAVMG